MGSPCFQVLTAWPGIPRVFRGSVNREPMCTGNAAPDPSVFEPPTRVVHLPPEVCTGPPAPGLLQLSPTPEVPPTVLPQPPSPSPRSCPVVTAQTTSHPRLPQLSPLEVCPPSLP